MLEFIILGFLKEFDLNGYQIKRHMKLGISNFMDASYGILYPTLKRLKNKGFITMKETIANGKLSKIYSLTDDGEKYFMEWLLIPDDISPKKPHNHLAKLYFYDYIDSSVKKEHYNYYIKRAQEEKTKLEAIIPVAEIEAGHDRRKTLVYGIFYYSNLIEFYKGMLHDGSDISRHTN